MTGIMGKSLGDCRKRLCESNVAFNVTMNMKAIAEVEEPFFGHLNGRK